MQRGIIIGPQNCHIKTGQNRVHIIIVKDAVGQSVKIVERANRLSQFLVQAVAGFLRCGVIGHKDRDFFTFLKGQPVGCAVAAG